MWKKLDAYMESYSGHERGILKAKHLEDYVLEIWFEDDRDVSIYELDFSPLINSPEAGVFAELKDKNWFSQVIGHYALTWNDPNTGESNENAIDMAPEAVRWLCSHHGRLIKAPTRAA
jgi:hypothetical protein